MKIQLPDHFFYSNKSQRGTAYVKDGVLYIDSVSFEAVMRTITYVLKGYDTCHYCSQKITDLSDTSDYTLICSRDFSDRVLNNSSSLRSE